MSMLMKDRVTSPNIDQSNERAIRDLQPWFVNPKLPIKNFSGANIC